MFIDDVVISVKAGDGGNGCLAFRREKFVPRGGPSGGDGGRGGDVILVASPHHNTLLHFRYNPEHSAERGRHGEGSNRTGRDGRSIELPVPVGTVVYNAETGEQICDLAETGQRFMVATGGRGGRGNARFATATHQAPTEHEDGTPGEAFRLRFELKLLADVGLVGFPNAGKSTLIARLSAARPKIANYPFTTLEPNLGVVEAGDRTFVLADIPGLIEGAHEGHGLGIQFLRHVERTKVLVHLVDVSDFSGRDPAHDFDVILEELASFNQSMIAKPMIVVASKVDACQDLSRIEAVRTKAASRRLPFQTLSAVTGEGVAQLRFALSTELFSLTQDAAAPTSDPAKTSVPEPTS
ncbi:MAG TPA: GTPase ObgE [Bryobacteraceae bacterium]|nr:GTPase ObgE [Bryobacteraceae bacterium]